MTNNQFARMSINMFSGPSAWDVWVRIQNHDLDHLKVDGHTFKVSCIGGHMVTVSLGDRTASGWCASLTDVRGHCHFLLAHPDVASVTFDKRGNIKQVDVDLVS